MDNDKNQLTDYTTVGLNKHMMPLDAPIAQGTDFVNPVNWDIYHSRNTVSAIHVKNISFSSLVGGTATLGGVKNGNGLLTVLNSGGTEVVRLDNTGIVVTAGTITGVQFTGTTTQFTGTFDTVTITGQSIHNGTLTNNKLITGGTLNPATYQASGTNEAAGSFVYIKSVDFVGSAVTMGTVRFKGIIYSNA